MMTSSTMTSTKRSSLTCTNTNSSLNPTAIPFNPNHQPQDPNFKICTSNARSHFKNEPQNNHTCLIHLNARSLLPKMTELRHIALQRRPDIIAVSETWLSPLVPSGAVDIPTYSNKYLCSIRSTIWPPWRWYPSLCGNRAPCQRTL